MHTYLCDFRLELSRTVLRADVAATASCASFSKRLTTGLQSADGDVDGRWRDVNAGRTGSRTCMACRRPGYCSRVALGYVTVAESGVVPNTRTSLSR